ncbi:lipid transferase CIDEC-like [Salvelinus alpinus]|uniref:lipid transferase CIDEC-like n=1 Tax=Salvelinus alpinus TaxID=8036 RepID=UPI0039FC8A2B
MDYAMKSLSRLSSAFLSKCVTASVSASASMTQQLLVRSRRPKPFQVTSADRNVKRESWLTGYETYSTSHWQQRTWPKGELALRVTSEIYLLERVLLNTPRRMRNELKPQPRKDVAKITFDLYKNNPQDFFGCLNVKATLHSIYSVSYDVRCYAAKKMLKGGSKMSSWAAPATSSSSWTRMTGQTPLPQEGKIKQLQSILMGRTAVVGKTVV